MGDGDARESWDVATLQQVLSMPPAERLVIDAEVGRGGTGFVQVTTDLALHRCVARKTMRAASSNDPGTAVQFVREAQIVSQLEHPGIVPVHDIGVDASGRFYFTMKLVRGRTLLSVIEALPEAPIEPATLFELLGVVVKVCEALSFAHSRGVIHCDIKPSNVMVGDFGEVYLTDWGSAQILAGGVGSDRPAREIDGGSPLRVAGATDCERLGIGTLAYMSPEQVRGEPLSETTDVFCTGALLYEILTRRPPYRQPSLRAALALAREGRYPPPQGVVGDARVPAGLAAIIDTAMAAAPRDRFASAELLRRALVEFMRGRGVFRKVRFDAGAWIVRQGEQGDRAYIIDEGRCAVTIDYGGEQVTIRSIGPGEVFGETAVLSPGPRTASVKALEAVVLQEVTGDLLLAEIDSMRPWMGTFVRTLADRFREGSAQPASAGPSAQDLLRQSVACLAAYGRAGSRGERWLELDVLGRLLASMTDGRPDRLRAALAAAPELAIEGDPPVVVARELEKLGRRLGPAPPRDGVGPR